MSGAFDFDNDGLFDLLRGVSALTASPMVADLAQVIALTPRPDLSIAFNHKQIASKQWLCNELFKACGGTLGRVLVTGGWYGVLSSMIFNDPRFTAGHITSLDIDEDCAPVAAVLNRRFVEEGVFKAVTSDMTAFDYAAHAPDVVINTSCEHIADLPHWLARLPPGTRVILQSNNYRREADHVACVDSVEELADKARLSVVDFSGALASKNYTRFMLIGRC